MGVSASTKTYLLTPNDLAVNPQLARRLPSVVAHRYHALPIAEDSGQITVAMADPDDAAARAAVAAALGASSCVVGCDPMTIDAVLAEVWPEERRDARPILVCAHASPAADQILRFARALGGLLHAHVSYVHPVDGEEIDCDALSQMTERGQYDLVVWGEPHQPLGRQLLSGPVYPKAIKRCSCSLLIARQPRWPLRRLLLVVRGEGIDDAAVDWVVRLARPSGAAVTVLAVVPPMPAMFSGCARMQYGLDDLLTTDTALGRQMRRITRWLVEWELESVLRLRQGSLDGQICREIAKEEYDLIAVAARPQSRGARWLLGDRIAALLRWADRSVLIAKPVRK